ncbi:uncharacterized protein LOC134204582 [Armigeres subalbatus]|uniref:uncharacterized protein LOC134204582 n=1 Tax=Armigeres subalbatus TaxID=124917 RepID=UPI002ED1BD41
MVQKLKLNRYPCRQEIGGVGNSLVVSNQAVNVRMGSHCSNYSAVELCHILKKITRSVFGWVAVGKMGFQHHGGQPKVAHVCSMEKSEDSISRFWELESCWSLCTQSPDETFCEMRFVANTFRDELGRFVVTLSKRTDVQSQLGRSKNIVVNRFHALERRLDANPNLKQSYTAFMSEYLQLNHMRKIDDANDCFPSYYLPHHDEKEEDSTTKKLRIVFYASCRTDSGVSLNQTLLVDDLYAISPHFRMRQYAVVVDAEKITTTRPAGTYFREQQSASLEE